MSCSTSFINRLPDSDQGLAYKGKINPIKGRYPMKRMIALLIVASLMLEASLAVAVRGDQARYAGGTVSAIQEETEGQLDFKGEKTMVFEWENGKWELPYSNITTIEYGQKIGRRVGAAIGTAIVVTPIGLFMLFSKKRKHFLSLGFTDENGKQQGALFELSKGTVRKTLISLEARTGKKVEYESEEAKKNVRE